MSDPSPHSAFLAPEISDLAPLFPGYEIECLIATGGMGAVYRAVQKSLDRTVAIKILPHEFSNDAAFCAGFEAEAKAMARLNHPNLIGVYDFGEVKGMLYIIMEFVPGKSVFHSAHCIAIDPKEVIRLVTGICNGLSHAHENGILHRDIKPSNILLDLNAQPKIGDFGLARPIGTKVQEGEEIFGTPHYTAPEVVHSPQSVGYRADVFSVGVMLHELLTGKLPAEDQRPASAIAHCDPRFDAIIRRATNPLPDLRYASAKEISNDLQAIASTPGPKVTVPRNQAAKGPPRPVSGPGGRPSYSPARRSSQSSSSSSGVIVLILVILVIIAAYIYISGNQPEKKAPVIPEPQHGSESSQTPPIHHSIENLLPDTPSTRKSEPTFSMRSNETTGSSEAGSKSATSPEPESTSTSPQTPKFDVDAFFLRARKIMQDRANPLIATHHESLGRNIISYEKSLKRFVRKIDYPKQRERYESSLEDYLILCKDKGNHIPVKLTEKDFENDSIRNLDNFDALRDEFIEKEAAIDDSLHLSLSQLAATYIIGLEKQIERLKAGDDPAAIELIQAEIDKTRSTESHFPNLMLDIDPTMESEEKDPVKSGEP